MHGLAAWKLIVPLAAIAVGGLVLLRPHPGKLSPPATASTTGTLGYLTQRELPDSVALLTPPPQPGSAAMGRDEEARDAALQLRGSARYALAVSDASREQADTAAAFQCALGTEINETRTPALYRLLAKVRLDVRAAAYPAKSYYKRPRPFVMYKGNACYAPDDENVRNDGAYPSARGAVGWAYAMVLAEINPARASELTQRARDFGESRVVCDEEWISDVDAGRTLADATVRHIRDKPAFRDDLDAARKEIAAAFASPVKPPGCEKETVALASR